MWLSIAVSLDDVTLNKKQMPHLGNREEVGVEVLYVRHRNRSRGEKTK